MGNACTFGHYKTSISQEPSPLSSLVFPLTSRGEQITWSQNKTEFLSQINCTLTIGSPTTTVPNNNLKSCSSHIYPINTVNLKKAIEYQQSSDTGPGFRCFTTPDKYQSLKEDNAKDMAMRRNFQSEKVGTISYRLPKEIWTRERESSDLKQKLWSFQASVSDLPEDGCVEYSKDSVPAKVVEDLRQFAPRAGNHSFQKLIPTDDGPRELDQNRRKSTNSLMPDYKCAYEGSNTKIDKKNFWDISSSGNKGNIATEDDKLKPVKAQWITSSNEKDKLKSQIESVIQKDLAHRLTEAKHLVNYKPTEVTSFSIVAGLYEGVDSSPLKSDTHLSKENKIEVNEPVQQVSEWGLDTQNEDSERKLISAKEECRGNVENKDQIQESKGRKNNIMDRLLESLLEDRTEKNENINSRLPTLREQSASPCTNNKNFESEKKDHFEGLRRSSERFQIQDIIKQKENVSDFDHVKFVNFLESSRLGADESTEGVKKDTPNGQQTRRFTLPSRFEESRILKSETKDESIKIDRKSREDCIEQQTVDQQLEQLQKELFEKMALLTSNFNHKALNGEIMDELKQIQQKIELLTKHESCVKGKEPQINEFNSSSENIKQKSNESRSMELDQRKTNLQVFINNYLNRKVSNRSDSPIFNSKSLISRCRGAQSVPRVCNLNLADMIHNKKTEISEKKFNTPFDSNMNNKLSNNLLEPKSSTGFLVTEPDYYCEAQEISTRPYQSGVSQRLLTDTCSYESKGNRCDKKNLLQLRNCRIMSTAQNETANNYISNKTPTRRNSRPGLSNQNQHYMQSEEKGPTEFYHSLLRKLSHPKNCPTYTNTQYDEIGSNLNNIKRSSTERSLSPSQAKSNRNLSALTRKQSTIVEKLDQSKGTLDKKPMYPNSRKTSIDKSRSSIGERNSLKDNKQREQQKKQTSSIGGQSGPLKEHSKNIPSQVSGRKLSLEKGTIQEPKTERVQILRADNNKSSDILRPRNIDYNSNKSNVSYREGVNRSDKKLSVSKSQGKIMGKHIENPYEKVRIPTVGSEKEEKDIYISIVKKGIEQCTNQGIFKGKEDSNNGIYGRRKTLTSVNHQIEQSHNNQAINLGGSRETKKVNYDYNLSIKLREKYIEEMAKKQNKIDDEDWALYLGGNVQINNLQSKTRIKNL